MVQHWLLLSIFWALMSLGSAFGTFPGFSVLHTSLFATGGLRISDYDASDRILSSIHGNLTLTQKESVPNTQGPQLASNAWRKSLRKVILPVGYPESVPDEYITYQKWNCIQDACSYLRGVISMSQVLKGLGVGDSTARPIAAALLWVCRDGIGSLASLTLTAFFSGRFQQNVKSWRFFADITNNIGIGLEVVSVLFPSLFVAMLCGSTIFKALCGTAAGAVNAAILLHLGHQGNVADVAAKNAAQHTVVSMACLSLSLLLTAAGSSLQVAFSSQILLLLSFVVLTVIHIYANVMALRCLTFRTLNICRLELLMLGFLNRLPVQSWGRSLLSSELALLVARDAQYQALETPQSIAQREPLVPPFRLAGSHSNTAGLVPGVHYHTGVAAVLNKLTDAIDKTAVLASVERQWHRNHQRAKEERERELKKAEAAQASSKNSNSNSEESEGWGDRDRPDRPDARSIIVSVQPSAHCWHSFCLFSPHTSDLEKSKALFQCILRQDFILPSLQPSLKVLNDSELEARIEVVVEALFQSFWTALHRDQSWDSRQLQLTPHAARFLRVHK